METLEDTLIVPVKFLAMDLKYRPDLYQKFTGQDAEKKFVKNKKKPEFIKLVKERGQFYRNKFL